MLVAMRTMYSAASGWPGSRWYSVSRRSAPSERLVSQYAAPLALVPCWTNACAGSFGGVVPRQMPVAMIHAWTSMPWACALVIRLSSGSKGAGAMAASVRGRLDREQKQRVAGLLPARLPGDVRGV